MPEFIKSFPLLQPGCHNSDEIIRDILSKVIPPEFISTISLPIIIRYLQSPDVYSSITEIPDDSDLHSYLYTFAYHLHPPLHLHQTRTDLTNEDKNTFDKIWASIRKYVQNVISSYIGRCFDQRWKFFKDLDKQPSSKLWINCIFKITSTDPLVSLITSLVPHIHLVNLLSKVIICFILALVVWFKTWTTKEVISIIYINFIFIVLVNKVNLGRKLLQIQKCNLYIIIFKLVSNLSQTCP